MQSQKDKYSHTQLISVLNMVYNYRNFVLYYTTNLANCHTSDLPYSQRGESRPGVMCSADGGPRPLFFPVYSAGPPYLHGYDLYSMQSNQCKLVGPTTAPPKKKTAKLTTDIHHTRLLYYTIIKTLSPNLSNFWGEHFYRKRTVLWT